MKTLLMPLCISLLALLLVIHPVIFLNDEWITTNQLSQLSEHKQILYNEGKYGTYPNGTPNNYFIERENILAYSSFLPIISYPFLILVQRIGDILPYFASILFSLLLLLVAFTFKDRFSGTKFTKILIGLSFVALLLNLIFYRSIPVTGESVPIEILAVVITHICIFLLLVLVIQAIMKTLFSDPAFATFGLLATIACSSYLFWTTTCKDHLDVAFIFAVLVLCLIRFTMTTDVWYLFSAFLSTGILTWVRPNYGPVLFFFLLGLTLFWVITRYKDTSTPSSLFLILTPIGTIIGLIPLFINNLCVTGHPLVFPFQKITTTTDAQYESFIDISSVSPSNTEMLPTVSGITDSIQTIVHLLLARVIPRVPFETVVNNFYAVFITPSTLKVPVLALVPLFVLGLCFLPVLIRRGTRGFEKNEKNIIISMIVLVLGTVCAYITTIGSLDTSLGIYPDIRYLSPVYIPLTIIGLIILSQVITDSAMIQKVVYYVLAITIGAGCCMPFILGALFWRYTFWDIFLWTNGIVTVIIYGLLLICLLIIYGWYRGMFRLSVLSIPLTFLIVLPLLWQVTMILLTIFSIGDTSHYPPLLPMFHELYEWIWNNLG